MPDWIDTGTESEASNYAEQFWSKLSYSLSDGAFWADEIKKLRDKPDERLAMAMAHLPLTAKVSLRIRSPTSFKLPAPASRSFLSSSSQAATVAPSAPAVICP